jgi:hypothetical protein
MERPRPAVETAGVDLDARRVRKLVRALPSVGLARFGALAVVEGGRLLWSFVYLVVRNLFALVWLLGRPRRSKELEILVLRHELARRVRKFVARICRDRLTAGRQVATEAESAAVASAGLRYRATRVERGTDHNGCNGCTRCSLGFAAVRSPDPKPLQTGDFSERQRTGANARQSLPCRRSWVRVPSSASEKPRSCPRGQSVSTTNL